MIGIRSCKLRIAEEKNGNKTRTSLTKKKIEYEQIPVYTIFKYAQNIFNLVLRRELIT